MLLADEIRIAKPKVILTFGTDVFAAVERLSGFDRVPHSDRPLKRGTLVVDDRRVDVLGLYHPGAYARRYWPASQSALIRLLRSPDYVVS
jgi:uracil-DNA glycosylase